MSDKKTGSCLCKAIKYEVTVESEKVHVCHCNWCQNWHGGPGMSVKVGADMVINGEEKLKWYKSSEWAKRGFCSDCGTHLFGKTDDGNYCGVHVGSFDDVTEFEVETHIFVDKKPSYYEFSDDTPRLTEQEFLEHIGAA